ncbi:ATP-dependent RNA helicase DHX [Acrasis kona]|uniref:RNA helicase n=1 Tax=Acrasis kona TaxID=1008807 RepID=A0AAW2ZD86_9EUKA
MTKKSLKDAKSKKNKNKKGRTKDSHKKTKSEIRDVNNPNYMKKVQARKTSKENEEKQKIQKRLEKQVENDLSVSHTTDFQRVDISHQNMQNIKKLLEFSYKQEQQDEEEDDEEDEDDSDSDEDDEDEDDEDDEDEEDDEEDEDSEDENVQEERETALQLYEKIKSKTKTDPSFSTLESDYEAFLSWYDCSLYSKESINQEEVDNVRQDELMVLSSVYPDEFQVHEQDHLSVKRTEDDSVELHMIMPKDYPYSTPILYLNSTLSTEQELNIIVQLVEKSKEANQGPIMYDLVCHLEEAYRQVKNEQVPKPRPSTIISTTEKKPLTTSQPQQTITKRHKPSETQIEHQLMQQYFESRKKHSSDHDHDHQQKTFEQEEEICKTLYQEHSKKQSKSTFQYMQQQRSKLPSHSKQSQIMDLINNKKAVVITGQTGSGKTTQVAQYILDHAIANHILEATNIICTQPRRISATSVAERVAKERDEQIGHSIGYSIRLESKKSKFTKLLFCTTGILLKMLESDPNLNSISHVIIDEVHERSIEIDFLLIILRRLIYSRSNLKIILMSATVSSDIFTNYFNCATIEIPGRTFPVAEFFLEHVIEQTNYTASHIQKTDYENHQQSTIPSEKQINQLYPSFSKNTKNALQILDETKLNYDLIIRLLNQICNGNDFGAILIFLPGLQEITNLYNLMNQSQYKQKDKYMLVVLHSSLSSAQQQLAFHSPKKNVRKIILSTNIAETSVTIDDVTTVIDCGKMKQMQHLSNLSMNNLKEIWISKANAKQRMGRAGRVSSGTCYHLFTTKTYQSMDNEQCPEMKRIALDQFILRIKLMGMGEIESVMNQCIEPPQESQIKSAISNLKKLHALVNCNDRLELTALGYHLATLPVDIRMGKMMIYASMFKCLDPVLTIAASMSLQSPFVSPMNDRDLADQIHKSQMVEKSDHLTLLKWYHEWNRISSKESRIDFCRLNFLSDKTFCQMQDLKREFVNLLTEIGFVSRDGDSDSNSNDEKVIKACLVCGLYPNVLLIKQENHQTTMHTAKHGQAFVHPSSVLFKDDSTFRDKYLVYNEMTKTTRVYVRDLSTVTPYSLLLFGGTFDKQTNLVTLDKWIKFKMDSKCADMIHLLRVECVKALAHKMMNPKSEYSSSEKLAMSTIINLIKSEK